MKKNADKHLTLTHLNHLHVLKIGCFDKKQNRFILIKSLQTIFFSTHHVFKARWNMNLSYNRNEQSYIKLKIMIFNSGYTKCIENCENRFWRLGNTTLAENHSVLFSNWFSHRYFVSFNLHFETTLCIFNRTFCHFRNYFAYNQVILLFF